MKKGLSTKRSGCPELYGKCVSTYRVLGSKRLELLQWHRFGSNAPRPLETECCCREQCSFTDLWSTIYQTFP